MVERTIDQELVVRICRSVRALVRRQEAAITIGGSSRLKPSVIGGMASDAEPSARITRSMPPFEAERDDTLWLH